MPGPELKLDDVRKDALREIGNICAGNAATALSQLLDKKIEINVPEILFLPVEDVPKMVGEDSLVTGLLIRILGDFPSHILLIFSQKDAVNLSALLTGKKILKHTVITDSERIALKEIGMVLANAYLGTLSVFVKWGLIPAAPQIVEDMAEALMDYILIQVSDVSKFALLIRSEFSEVSTKITGHFFLIPSPAGLEVILKATEF